MTTTLPTLYSIRAERYGNEAACLARCAELTAAVDAHRAELSRRQIDEGPHGEVLLGADNYVRYVPDISVGGDYWRPRMVAGDR